MLASGSVFVHLNVKSYENMKVCFAMSPNSRNIKQKTSLHLIKAVILLVWRRKNYFNTDENICDAILSKNNF